MAAEHATTTLNITAQFKIAEYNAIRQELLKRVEFRYQIISFTLVALGAFLSIGTNESSATILLVFPIVSHFLAMSWTSNGDQTLRMARYIRQNIESHVHGAGWEQHLYDRSRKFSLPILASTFLIADAICLMVGFSRFSYTLPELVLAVVDGIVVLWTLAVIVKSATLSRS